MRHSGFRKTRRWIQVSMKIKMLLQKTILLYCLLEDWTQFSFGRCVISSWLPLRCCSTWVWYSAVVVRVCDKLYRVTFSSAYLVFPFHFISTYFGFMGLDSKVNSNTISWLRKPPVVTQWSFNPLKFKTFFLTLMGFLQFLINII